MRIRMSGIVGALALAISACGSVGGKSPTEAQAPSPVNLTVYVNNSRVSVSPSSLGAGPVVFIVTNQSSQAEALAISRSGQSHPLASTAPINPQGTTQLSVNFGPGHYMIGTATRGSTDAALSQPAPIRPAAIHIGSPRRDSSGALLAP
jgi:hypothetical protein